MRIRSIAQILSLLLCFGAPLMLLSGCQGKGGGAETDETKKSPEEPPEGLPEEIAAREAEEAKMAADQEAKKATEEKEAAEIELKSAKTPEAQAAAQEKFDVALNKMNKADAAAQAAGQKSEEAKLALAEAKAAAEAAKAKEGGAEKEPGAEKPKEGGAEKEPGAEKPKEGGAEKEPGAKKPKEGGAEKEPGAKKPKAGGAEKKPGAEPKAGAKAEIEKAAMIEEAAGLSKSLHKIREDLDTKYVSISSDARDTGIDLKNILISVNAKLSSLDPEPKAIAEALIKAANDDSAKVTKLSDDYYDALVAIEKTDEETQNIVKRINTEALELAKLKIETDKIVTALIAAREKVEALNNRDAILATCKATIEELKKLK